MEVTALTALVTRDVAIVENTFGTIATASTAMIASTPIISIKLKPDSSRLRQLNLWLGDVFMGILLVENTIGVFVRGELSYSRIIWSSCWDGGGFSWNC